MGSPSLVSNITKANSDHTWSRQRKRAYHRINSILGYWRARGYSILWLTLTSSNDADPSNLAYNHRKLKQKVERKFPFKNIEHLAVRTSEGNGVLHLFWACKRKGFRNASFYVPQGWLSSEWQKLHDSPIVWVTRCKTTVKSVRKLSNYAVSQYCSNQEKFERLTWSWFRVIGICRRWQFFKQRVFSAGRYNLKMWYHHLAGGTILFPSNKYGYSFAIPPPPSDIKMIEVPIVVEEIELRDNCSLFAFT